MIHWYVFKSKARKEKLLCEQLRIRHIETFFPTIRIRAINSHTERVQPYFPGYVFGHVDLEEAGRSIREWVPGAIGIVNFGGEPVSVSDHLIRMLKRHLETINSSTSEEVEKFRQGDVVTILKGAFAGYEAIFNARLPGRDRVEVLLKMLQGSRQLRVELSVEKIALRKPDTSLIIK